MKQIEEQKVQPDHNSKEKDVKVPFLFKLEIKDLLNPITIRRVQIYKFIIGLSMVAVAGYYVWDSNFRAPSGSELVNEMVIAAGGMTAWNNIKSGQFTRTQNVYDMSGKQISKQIETIYFKKDEAGTNLRIKTQDDNGKEVIISKDKEGFWATKESIPTDPRTTAKDLGMMCDSKFCEPTCEMQMAFFRFSMPFKLTDYGVKPSLNNVSSFGQLNWNPLENVDMEKDPLVLDISYIPTVGKDKWRFLVNPETKLIHKVEYYNKSDIGTYRPEEIYWTDHKTVDGITFSHKWVKYHSNGKIMNEYIYSDVAFNNDVDEEFFDRPEGKEWTFSNK